MRTLLLLLALLAASPALAAQAVALSVEALASGADAVVRGRVMQKSATVSEDGRRVFTLVDVEVADTWRGSAPRTVRVIVPGGVAGNLGQRVEGTPAFVEGEEVVVFLHRAEAGGFRVAGLAQGKYSVAAATATPDLSQLHFVGRQVAPGERLTEAMPLAELERRVRSAP
jgi:transcriptional regulator GlxA family with amidase domain